MDRQAVCPYCGAALTHPEAAKDECPACHRRVSAMTGELTPALGPASDYLSAQFPDAVPLIPSIVRMNMPPPGAFRLVRQGVSFVWWGVGLGTAYAVFVVVAYWFIWAMKPRASEWATRGLDAASPFLFLIAGAVVLVGVAFCCFVPKACGAGKWVRCLLASLVFFLCLTLVFAAGVIWPDWLKAGCLPGIPGLALLTSLGVALFGWLCYFLILAQLARFFGDHRLAKALSGYFVVSLCGMFASVVGGCVLLAAVADQLPGQAGPFVSTALLGLWLVVAIGLAGWLLALLSRLHRLMPVPADPTRR